MSVVITLLLIVAAIAFGSTLGLVIALVLAGSDFGQLPVITVPIAIVASIAFAISPFRTAGTRFVIMFMGAVGCALLTNVLMERPSSGWPSVSTPAQGEKAQAL